MPKKRAPYLSVVSDRTVTEKPFNARLTRRVVSDPYDGTPITVTASLRDDPLARLGRNQLAPHLYNAGLELQRLFEAAEIAGVKAMDFTREPVDGGTHIREPYSDRHRKAADDIADIKGRLTRDEFSILKLVLAERLFLSQIAAHRGWKGRKAAAVFKAALDSLSSILGFSGQASARGKQHDKYSAMARAA
jgi:hypothetical protein